MARKTTANQQPLAQHRKMSKPDPFLYNLDTDSDGNKRPAYSEEETVAQAIGQNYQRAGGGRRLIRKTIGGD